MAGAGAGNNVVAVEHVGAEVGDTDLDRALACADVAGVRGEGAPLPVEVALLLRADDRVDLTLTLGAAVGVGRADAEAVEALASESESVSGATG